MAGDIEAKIYHNPDEPSVGTVDYVPFINASPCPATPSPTPSPSPTASPTASPTPSPSPTVGPTIRKHGDLNCDGSANHIDAIGPLLYLVGLGEDVTQNEPCPELGDPVLIAGTEFDGDWGDVDCSGEIDTADAMAELAAQIDSEYPHPGTCPDIGETTSVSEPQ